MVKSRPQRAWKNHIDKTESWVAYRDGDCLCVVVRGLGRWAFSQWGKTSGQTFSNLFLKTLTEGAVTTEAGSLFQYFTTLTEKPYYFKKKEWISTACKRGSKKNATKLYVGKTSSFFQAASNYITIIQYRVWLNWLSCKRWCSCR